MAFDFESLRDILVCPKSKSPLAYDGERLICTSAECRLQFDIRDDIPVMLVEEAKELSPDEWNEAMARCGEGE
ncbi:MAG TPA: hypothetical protein EYP14_16970 [Planctomycetaceae bacterium]|nr:hypothetical protein [Planctomycetaceae bacterium]